MATDVARDKELAKNIITVILGAGVFGLTGGLAGLFYACSFTSGVWIIRKTVEEQYSAELSAAKTKLFQFFDLVFDKITSALDSFTSRCEMNTADSRAEHNRHATTIPCSRSSDAAMQRRLQGAGQQPPQFPANFMDDVLTGKESSVFSDANWFLGRRRVSNTSIVMQTESVQQDSKRSPIKSRL